MKISVAGNHLEEAAHTFASLLVEASSVTQNSTKVYLCCSWG